MRLRQICERPCRVGQLPDLYSFIHAHYRTIEFHNPMIYMDVFNDLEETRAKSSIADYDLERNTALRTANSWEQKVVVFIKSNDDLYIASKATVKGLGIPQARLTLPWMRNEKDIFVPPLQLRQKEEVFGEYVATVKLGKVLKGHRVQRLLGRVKSLYVFEAPLPVGAP